MRCGFECAPCRRSTFRLRTAETVMFDDSFSMSIDSVCQNWALVLQKACNLVDIAPYESPPSPRPPRSSLGPWRFVKKWSKGGKQEETRGMNWQLFVRVIEPKLWHVTCELMSHSPAVSHPPCNHHHLTQVSHPPCNYHHHLTQVSHPLCNHHQTPSLKEWWIKIRISLLVMWVRPVFLLVTIVFLTFLLLHFEGK